MKDASKRLCIVIQRYGEEVSGGAESYAKQYAEQLVLHGYTVDVATTCALDYRTWKNHYTPGDSEIAGVHIHRFPVAQECDMERFAALCATYLMPDAVRTPAHDREWLMLRGPDAPELLDFLHTHRDDYDLFLFMTYMYCPTVLGLPLVDDKAVLFPFLHDEPAARVPIYDAVFTSPRAIVYNSEEEREFAYQRFDNELLPSTLTGIGIVLPDAGTLPPARERFPQLGNAPYLLYMGRIDDSKRCDVLFEYFRAYKEEFPSPLKLVLTGGAGMEIPDAPDILHLGFVSEEEKHAILRESLLLVLPSEFESLSIVLLEAFAQHRPALVNGHSPVLRGHCRRSNAGLYYFRQEDFNECLSLLLEKEALRQSMGENGARYVDTHYRWEVILQKLNKLFADIN